MRCRSITERPGPQIRGVVARGMWSFCNRPRPSVTLLDLASCSQRVARPSPCPKQQASVCVFGPGLHGLCGDKRMGRMQSRPIGFREVVEGSQGRSRTKEGRSPKRGGWQKVCGRRRGGLQGEFAWKRMLWKCRTPSARQRSLCTNAAAACLGMPCSWPRVCIKPTTWDWPGGAGGPPPFPSSSVLPLRVSGS